LAIGCVKLVLADHDPLPRRAVREAMSGRRDVIVVGEAGTFEGVLAAVSAQKPDVVLIDTELPPAGGVLATAQLVAIAPRVRVVLFAVQDSDEIGLRALQAGASGFLSKDIDMSALARAVRSVARGEAAISRRLTLKTITRLRTLGETMRGLRPLRSPLTDRQWEILDLAAEGRTPTEMAKLLDVSVETIRGHVRSAVSHLGAETLPDALRAADRLRTGAFS
jgi:two-component system, NarL family, response regulator LiaR